MLAPYSASTRATMTLVSDEPGRDETGRDNDFDEAWARIVAEYDRTPDDSTDHPTDRTADHPVDHPADHPGRNPGAGSDGTPFVLSLGDGPTEPAPAWSEDDSRVAGDWVPPLPPPLPRPTGATGAAWVALAGGPLLLLASIIVGWRLPTLLIAASIIGFVGGLVFLIAHMDDHRHRDGWDDGAQL